MDVIHTTLKNFSFIEQLNSIFPKSHGFEYSRKGVIRAIVKPYCSKCNIECVRNGWDLITRKDLFILKIGKFKCPQCKDHIHSDLPFWEQFIGEWKETLASFFLRLSDKDVALRVISDIMSFISPMSKDSVMRMVFSAIGKLIIPEFKTKYQIVHYDEQHPKKGRQQQYRLTLICAINGDVIADELFDDKDSSTVESFLSTNLDTQKETIIITDDCPWYPTVFKEIWGNKVKHQLCILHLNKLVVGDLPRVKSLQDMHNTYLLLNIFFDRSKELQFIEMLIENKQDSEEWIKKARKRFNNFVRSLEKARRRDKQNHILRTHDDAKSKFEKLKKERQLLPKPLQKRLKYIENHWKQFTLFHEIEDCPHTNNAIENYFSTSLKTHRKKQFRTIKGLKNKIKLSNFKRNIGFAKPIISFLEWGKILWVLGG
jgi:hypothetical protein